MNKYKPRAQTWLMENIGMSALSRTSHLAAEFVTVAAEAKASARAKERKRIAQAAESLGRLYGSTELTEFAAAIREDKE